MTVNFFLVTAVLKTKCSSKQQIEFFTWSRCWFHIKFWGFVFVFLRVLLLRTIQHFWLILVVSCLSRKEEQKGLFTLCFWGGAGGGGIPIWLKVGNTVFGKPENGKYKFLLVLILLGFFYIHLMNLTRITFVTGNIKDSALSACVANGIPLKMINQAVPCFALEAPWRDKLATKVIKSSQIHFILLTFKKAWRKLRLRI